MKCPDARARRIRRLSLSIISFLLFFAATSLVIREKSAEAARHLTVLPFSFPEDVTETTTLTDPVLRTWQLNTTYIDYSEPCDSVSPFPRQDPPDGQVIVGYLHDGRMYFKYLKTVTCTESKAAVFRGSLWFDLSPIASKAPPPRVYVTNATLNFKKFDSVARDNSNRVLRNCQDQLMIATEDWRKDGYSAYYPPGADPLSVTCTPATVSGGSLVADCSMDVRSTVNNWISGKQDNFGFVMNGENEKAARDTGFQNREVCQTRYGEFSLAVTYKYEKAPTVLYVPPPTDKPILTVAPGVIGGRTNVALAANGGVASASSTTPGYTASGAINGDEKGVNFGKDGYWSSAKTGFPEWLEVDFSGLKTISEIDVFTTQDNYSSPIQPTETTTFSNYGLSAFEVQYWDNATGGWQGIPGANVTGNNLVWRKFGFASIKTAKIRVLTHGSPDGYSRLTEVEAWTR